VEQKKKKKRKKNYVLLVLCDSPADGVKRYSFSKARINFLYTMIAVLLLVAGGYVVFTTVNNSKALRLENTMSVQIKNLEEENAQLKKDNDTLTDKVAILSETVNQKVTAEKELEEKTVPSGFPLSGTADLKEMSELVEEGDTEVERPMIVFETSSEVTVISSGAGEILVVAEDAEYGHQIQIDHGNGFVSIYRCGTVPKVKEGDEVTKGTLLFELDDDVDNGMQLVYQVKENGEYIAPADVMEING